MPAAVKRGLPSLFDRVRAMPACEFEVIPSDRIEKDCDGGKYTLVDAMFHDKDRAFMVQYMPFVTTLASHPERGEWGISTKHSKAHCRGSSPAYRFKLTSSCGNSLTALSCFEARSATADTPKVKATKKKSSEISATPAPPGARVYFVLRKDAPGCIALRIRSDVREEYHRGGCHEPELVLPDPCNRTMPTPVAAAAAAAAAPTEGAITMPAVPASDFNVAAPCPGAMGDHSMPPTPRGSYDADVSARGAVGASSGAAAVMWDAGPDLEDGFNSDAMESIASTPCPDAAAPGVECGAGWGGGWSGSHGADAPAGKAVGAPSAAQEDWLALDLPGSGPKASVPSLPSPTMEPWLEDPYFQSQAAEQGLGQTLPVSPAFWSGVELDLRRSMLAGEAEDWFKDSQLEFLLRQPSGGPQGAEVEGPVWMAGAEVPARIPDEDCGEGKVARVLLAEALGRPRARQRVADEDDEGESDDEWEPHKRRRRAL